MMTFVFILSNKQNHFFSKFIILICFSYILKSYSDFQNFFLDKIIFSFKLDQSFIL